MRVLGFDDTGAGYRLNSDSSGSPIALFKTSDCRLSNTDVAPTWTQVYSFGGSSGAYTQLDSSLKVSGHSVISGISGRLFISTDKGVSFAQIKILKPKREIYSPAIAADGTTIYAYDLGYIFVSTNDGATWTTRPLESSQERYIDLQRNGRLLMSLNNFNRGYLFRHSRSSNYSSEVLSTVTAFDNITSTNNFSAGWYSYASAIALSRTDDSITYALGNGRATKTTDFGTTWSTAGVTGAPGIAGTWNLWYPGWISEVSPWNSEHVYYTGEWSAYKFWRYDHTTRTNTDLTAFLPFNDPVAVELISNGQNGYRLRILSSTGKIAESSDGSTFLSANSAGWELVPNQSNPRSTGLMRSPKQNPALIVTTVRDQFSNPYYRIYWSLNGGISWTRSQAIDCDGGRDIAFTATKVLLSCGSELAPVLAFPIPTN